MSVKPYQNFELSLKKLEEFISTYDKSEKDRAAIIKAFEFVFEQSWKAIQKIAINEGVDIGSPKKAFSFALQQKWISSEQVWLKILEDRNLTTHTYKEALAHEVSDRIISMYATEFRRLLNSIQNN